MTEHAALPKDFHTALQRTRSVVRIGRVNKAVGIHIAATGLDASIGDICDIVNTTTGVTVAAEVVGVSEGITMLTPLAPVTGISAGSEIRRRDEAATIGFGPALLGRVIDARGDALDGRGDIEASARHNVYARPPGPMERPIIAEPFCSGLRAIDSTLTVGIGQRLGIFAMAGVGKSTLLGMLARNSEVDVTVIALIGERGREVREIVEDNLGPEGMKKSVVVVATSDRPAMERVRAAHVATAIAEGFRDQGKSVLLLMDSVTRFARALREIGLSAGEPPVRRGLPPSVFAELPRLFERAGRNRHGSITAFYTVLVEDEDGDDPVGEESRSILDGHILLSRELAAKGHYPAIDVTESISRIFPRLAGEQQRADAEKMRSILKKYEEIEFLLQVGEYQRGQDGLADEAIDRIHAVNRFLRQPVTERQDREVSINELHEAVEGTL